MKNALELLSQIRIASPCHADWDEMTGDDRVRFCGLCEKNVYNLSALTSEQAVSLIREKEGRLCTRFFQRADGTMLTADCPVGVHHRIQKKRRLATLAASLAGLLSFSGCTKFDDGSGTSAATPPAKQEQISKTQEARCLMGLPAFRPGLATRQAAAVPEVLPAPREATVD
jgi:hypothetical protein